MAEVAETFGDPNEQLAVLAELRVWVAIREQVRQVGCAVLATIRPSPDLKALRTTPGIGPVLGGTILLETGPIARFAEVRNFLSYCRMVDSKHLSNGKKKGEGHAKCGNRFLCWAFIEAANYAVRYCPQIQRWYNRKASETLRVNAVKATGHKLARACYYLLRDGGTFDVKRAFG